MNTSIAWALLGGGILLIIFGISASDSLSSDMSRFFTGAPTDKTIWLLAGGVAATIVGGFGLLRRSR